MWRLSRDGRPMLAVLSYHSWEVGVPTLREDVRALRAAGWTTVSASDALAFVRRERVQPRRCVLVTTDDGHVEDEEWASALHALECPAVTFVCSGLVPPDRLAFYRRMAAGEEFAVEDHGFRHAQHISSSRVVGYAHERTPARARDGVTLAPGEPLLPTGSEVATRRFDPDPEAIELLVSAGASATAAEIRGDRWRRAVEDELVRRRLAVRRLGGLFLRGRFESREQYEARVTEYLRGGRAKFESAFGRAPQLYAYTWWAGNETTDEVLRTLGYAGSLRGTGEMQLPDGRTFAIPRIPIAPATSRPLDLDGIASRGRVPRPDLQSLRHAAKRILGIA